MDTSAGEHLQMGCGPSRPRGTRYESFVKDTNKSIEEASRAITNKTEEKASAEADKTAAEEDKNSAMNEQQQNQNENADLHKACDFTLNNFEVPTATDVMGSLGVGSLPRRTVSFHVTRVRKVIYYSYELMYAGEYVLRRQVLCLAR